MTTRQYAYFYELALSDSISSAARRLGISQAALSKFITQTETYYQTQLFVRGQHLTLTPAGHVMFETARKILDTKNTMLTSVCTKPSSGQERLLIASTPFRGTELYSRIYNRWISLYPSVPLLVREIYSNRQERAIHEHEVDFAFGVGLHTPYSDVLSVPASRTELLLAVPTFHPMARYASPDPNEPASVTIQAFRDTPFVLRDQKNNIRIEADRVFQNAGFKPVIAFESSNSITVESMIRRGTGVGFFSKRYVFPEKDLVFFRLDPPCYETFYIRYPRDLEVTDPVRSLIALIHLERLKTRGTEPIDSEFLSECVNALTLLEKERGIEHGLDKTE